MTMETYVFKLPDVGEGTTEAEVVAWHVAVGDAVKQDQPLVDVMTEKATVEITAPVSGIVDSISAAPGDMAAVGSVLVIFRLESLRLSDTAIARAQETKAESTAPASEPPPTVSVTPAESAAPVLNSRPLASPAVRRRARELSLSLKSVAGSGPDGRILDEDLNRIANAKASPAPAPVPLAVTEGVEVIRFVGLRRKIADRMTQSKRNIPHFGYVEEVDVTELETLRSHLNEKASKQQPKLSPLAFIMRAVTRAIPLFPNVNATYDGDAGVLHRYKAVHIGVATQTPGGLMVPVVRNVEVRSLWDCAREIARVAELARTGKATRAQLSGSTLTLTSLGSLGGIAATPVINYPEVAIIGPNRIVERPSFRAGIVVPRKMMNLSSSFDHRVVDGYDAAAFIQHIKEALEHPATLFIDPA